MTLDVARRAALWGDRTAIVDHDAGDRISYAGLDAGAADAEALESFARERLADYEVPREFAFVDELPTSGPGKLDRAELDARYGE